MKRRDGTPFTPWNIFRTPSALPKRRGSYYKLGYATNAADQLHNFAPNPPTSTDPAVAVGKVAFEAVDEGGEQSAFDSGKNGGRDAITPLSGNYSWGQTVLKRPTPGVAFDLRIGYSSANGFNGYRLENYDPFASAPLGRGWRHTFETRILPSQYFSPIAGTDTLGLMGWDGSIDTWDLDLNSGAYKTRHKEYRGEITLEGATIESCII